MLHTQTQEWRHDVDTGRLNEFWGLSEAFIYFNIN